jgi:hypothetical protein
MKLSTRPRPWLPPKSAFAGFGFPPEVIVVAVRWYLRFNRRCCIKRSSRSPAAKLLVRSNSAAQLGLEDLDKAILLSGLNPD